MRRDFVHLRAFDIVTLMCIVYILVSVIRLSHNECSIMLSVLLIVGDVYCRYYCKFLFLLLHPVQLQTCASRLSVQVVTSLM